MIGAFVILLITTTGLAIAAIYIYNLVDADRRDEMEKADLELAQVLSLQEQERKKQ